MLFPEAGFDPMPAPIPTPPGARPDSFHFTISDRSRCFDGHFDDAPILPGVVHLALALSACARQDPANPRTPSGLRDVRFKRALGPGDAVVVILSEGAEPLSVRFEIRCGDETATVGVLLFAPPDSSHGG